LRGFENVGTEIARGILNTLQGKRCQELDAVRTQDARKKEDVAAR